MVTVTVTNPETKETHEFYMDNKLKRMVDNKILPLLLKEDEDCVIIIDGDERTGKSTFGMQFGKAIDPTLSLDRVCFTPEDFRKAIINAKKGQCVIFDEAYRGLGSAGTLTETNRILTGMMMEMGQKNLLVIIILPTFFLLSRYAALWRARGLFHVFKSKGRKGYWRFYNKRKKKLLFLHTKAKKEWSYGYVKSKFKGRFYKKYIVDEAEYRKKKAKSFSKGYRATRSDVYLDQRNRMIWLLHSEEGYGIMDIEKLFGKYGIKLKKTNIGDIIKAHKNLKLTNSKD